MEPDERAIHQLLAEVFTQGVKTVFINHCYKFNKKVMLQVNSGPIGLETTGNIARLVTIYFDLIFVARLAMIGIIVYLYLRYIDDGNIAVSKVPRSKSFDVDRLRMIDSCDSSETVKCDDQRTMSVVRQVADSCIDMLSWTSDTMSQHKSRCLPVLDLELYIYYKDGRPQIGYKHYAKPMSNTSISYANIHENSCDGARRS